MFYWSKEKRLLRSLEEKYKEEMLAILIIMDKARKRDEQLTHEEVLSKMMKAGYDIVESAFVFKGLECLGMIGHSD